MKYILLHRELASDHLSASGISLILDLVKHATSKRIILQGFVSTAPVDMHLTAGPGQANNHFSCHVWLVKLLRSTAIGRFSCIPEALLQLLTNMTVNAKRKREVMQHVDPLLLRYGVIST